MVMVILTEAQRWPVFTALVFSFYKTALAVLWVIMQSLGRLCDIKVGP